MTHAHFCALMIARRAMGDLGQEVVLTQESFDRLAEDCRGRATPINPFEARERGELVVNTCNGPTSVRFHRSREFTAPLTLPELQAANGRLCGRVALLETDVGRLEKSSVSHAMRLDKVENETMPGGVSPKGANEPDLRSRIKHQEDRHAALVCLLRARGILSDADRLIGGTG